MFVVQTIFIEISGNPAQVGQHQLMRMSAVNFHRADGRPAELLEKSYVFLLDVRGKYGAPSFFNPPHGFSYQTGTNAEDAEIPVNRQTTANPMSAALRRVGEYPHGADNPIIFSGDQEDGRTIVFVKVRLDEEPLLFHENRMPNL